MRQLTVLTSLLVFVVLSSCANTKTNDQSDVYHPVSIFDDNIQVHGANYIYQKDELLSFYRFSEEALALPQHQSFFKADNARTNSGIRLQFKTNSSKVKLVFEPQQGTNRSAEYAVLQDGVQVDTFAFNGNKSKQPMVLEFDNVYKGRATLFEIILPSMANVALASMELMGASELESFSKNEQAVYLAIGNSITHGVGQGSAAYKTYPYLLAKALNYDYYNLAVGGAKVSQTIADMTAEMPKADLITILIGYNDLMFNGRTTAEYISVYSNYLKTIRMNHPKADIYCITLTHTRAIKSDKTGITPDEYRIALKRFIYQLQSEGDKKLHVIEGDKITSEANLRPDFPTDKVHFGYRGAELFAKELYQIIKPK